jgi:glycosyltransferase involved in cell wall biosynthesis
MHNTEMQPLISVVIPVFNEEKRVERAIRSIMEQTYKNLEIIVIDDGSTDKSAEIIQRLAKEDSRVQYHLLPYQGNRKNWRGYDINAGYAARAHGYKIAKGAWITTQDSDDASLLNRIEVEYELAQKYNATMVTVFWMQAKPEHVGMKLDVEQIFKDKGEAQVVIRPEVINKVVEESRGPLMRLSFHRFIPFAFKWFPYTRRLFYGKYQDYPGADNCVLFKREIIEAGINLRHRNARTWGVPSGRGSGRDFLCQTAHTFKNNWSFRLPIYLWDVNSPPPGFEGYEKYLIS